MSRLVVSASPHIGQGERNWQVMLDVIIALTPAILFSIWSFGMNALVLIALCTGAAVFFEWGVRRILKRPTSVGDFSAALTGILLAMNLPPTVPLWMALTGTFVAVVIAKELAGGLGHNIFNPALVGRAFMHVSFGAAMGLYLIPQWWQKTGAGFFDWAYLSFQDGAAKVNTLASGAVDAVTGATPLQLIKPALGLEGDAPSTFQLFVGNVGGSLGETSALALLLGGVYLIIRKRIDWRVPAMFIGTVAIFSAVLSLGTGKDLLDTALFHVLAGGVMLAAFFMLTDYVTAPVTVVGRMIFAFGAGILTVLMRFFGGFPEGVVYAILFMNALVPLIDKYVRTTAFGRAT